MEPPAFARLATPQKKKHIISPEEIQINELSTKATLGRARKCTHHLKAPIKFESCIESKEKKERRPSRKQVTHLETYPPDITECGAVRVVWKEQRGRGDYFSETMKKEGVESRSKKVGRR